MKCRGDLNRREHAHRRRQVMVQGANHRGASIAALERHDGDLAKRVDAGVGAPGAGHRDRRPSSSARASSSSP